jgi:hypothetical protein
MNRANYTDQQFSRYPLRTDSLEFIQQQIFFLQNLTKIMADVAGGKYILSGAEQNPLVVSQVVLRDGILVIDGEIIPFRGMQSGAYINVYEDHKTLTAGVETFQSYQVIKHAQQGSQNQQVNGKVNVGSYLVSDFVRLPSINDIKNNYATKSSLSNYATMALLQNDYATKALLQAHSHNGVNTPKISFENILMKHTSYNLIGDSDYSTCFIDDFSSFKLFYLLLEKQDGYSFTAGSIYQATINNIYSAFNYGYAPHEIPVHINNNIGAYLTISRIFAAIGMGTTNNCSLKIRIPNDFEGDLELDRIEIKTII